MQNKFLQEENHQLKESLQKANTLNEEKKNLDDGYLIQLFLIIYILFIIYI